jgi:hypothetical protein
MRQLTAIVAVMFMAAGVSAFIAEVRTAATLQSTPPSTPRPGHERLADLPTGETFRHQGRSSILDLLVWGAQMNVDLSDYPPDVRAEAETVITRSKAYQSKRVQPTESDGLSRMVHQARVTYERRLVAMARTPGADAAALAYVTDLAPCYEWEGYSDCPAREASFANEYQRTQPGAPFSDLLPLLEAHRWLCAAEGFDYEENAQGAASARARYGASLKAAAASGDRLVRIGAAELEARGTCIRTSRE